MKIQLLLLFTIHLSLFTLKGQTNKPCNNFDCAYKKAETFLKQAAYQKALDNLDSAEGYLTDTNTKEKEQIKQLRRRLFVAIEKEKEDAKRARDEAKRQTEIAKKALAQVEIEKQTAIEEKNKAKVAEEVAQIAQKSADSAMLIANTEKANVEKEKVLTEKALLKADKIINAFYFYNNQFALAFKGNKYGYIDREGEAKIPYIYDEALPFNEITGLAWGSVNNEDRYLIDTLGQQYLIAKHVDSINFRTGAIDLNNQGISKLPKNLDQCKILKFLWLSGNNLDKIKTPVVGIDSVIKVDLSTNRLEEIPDWVVTLTNLDYLSLRSNSITDANNCQKLKNLQVLDLGYNRIRDFPKKIKVLNNLKRLDLSHNSLTILPPEIGDLSQMHTLLLNNNGFDYLPDSINKLQKLKHLEINSNFLDSVPNSIGFLHQLEFLSLSFNRIKKLPKSFSNLINLKFLDLSYNKISTMPDEFQYLKNIEEINLVGNDIKDLPMWLCELKQLKVIYMGYNSRIVIPDCLKNIVKR